MAAFNDFNQKIMDEFRANRGKVGGRFDGVDILILTSTGRKSGQMRWHPIAYSTDGERYIIVASKGGASTSPDWYHNLVANGSAVIEVGSDVILVEATIATGAERERLYAQHASRPRVRRLREEHHARDPGRGADAKRLTNAVA